MINEPSPFNRKWFSHKFHGPGLRYEVAVCIQTGDIVWINGPFACGRWPDIKIFRLQLRDLLSPGEMVEADRGYRGEPTKIRTPDEFVSLTDRKAKSRARARHETVNKRLKQWGSLKQRFRHDLGKHKLVFAAVAVCTQLCFEMGEQPFPCNY
jgi:DDE superfamily endonuclease